MFKEYWECVHLCEIKQDKWVRTSDGRLMTYFARSANIGKTFMVDMVTADIFVRNSGQRPRGIFAYVFFVAALPVGYCHER